MNLRSLPLCIACVAVSCGGSSSKTSTSNFAGVYTATYSGTYTVTTPSGVPGGSNTETGTVTVTDLPNGDVGISFQVTPNPPSGAIDFALMGNSGMAVAAASGNMCFVGQINGNTQSNCCTSCSITFSGSTFVQPNAGIFSGTTAAGAPYAGTYSGTWSGTKQ